MADFEFIQSEGVVVADTSTTLANVQQSYRDAANDQSLTVDKGPLSVLINAITESQDAVARNNAQMANQFNPNMAGDIFLDALLAWTDSERDAGEPTRVTATVTGDSGAFIPAGSLALTDPNITTVQYAFLSESDVEIGLDGTATVDFLSEEKDAINVPANALTTVGSSVLGWRGIDNAASGIAGRPEQTDSSARFDRRLLLFNQSKNMPASIVSAVTAVDGVKSMSFYNNNTASDVVIDGRTIGKHSTYSCIDGGNEQDIIDAMALKLGQADTTGDVVGTYLDDVSASDYTVRFDRPNDVAVGVKIWVRPSGSFQSPETVTKDAILAYKDGLLDGYRGFVVNGNVNPFEITDAVNDTEPTIRANRCQVELLSGGGFQYDEVEIKINERATLDITNIQVIVE